MAASSWQKNKLYILLSDRNNPGTFHWGLYLTEDDPHGGYIFHAVDEGGVWKLDCRHSKTVIASRRLLVAIEVGEDAEGMREHVANAAQEAARKAIVNCRVFAKDCLALLGQMGVITIMKDVDAIEEEAKTLGQLNDPTLNPAASGRSKVQKSRMSS